MTLTLWRPAGQVWTSDAAPTPPGQITVPYLGYALDTKAQFTGMSAEVGQLVVRRSYNNLATGVPTSWSASAAGGDAALGASISYLSIKTDPAKTAAGDYDAKLTAFAKTIPAGSYLSWYPEGEAKRHGNNPTAFAAALKRVYEKIKAANSQVFVGPCWMTYTLTPAATAPYNDPENWYTGTLDDNGDFVAWDGYNWDAGTKWQTFPQVFAQAIAWTRARTDLPFVIAEANTVADPANGQRRGDWWAGVYDYAVQEAMPIVCGWQGSSYPQFTVYSPDDAPALAAISDLNATTKAAHT